MKRQHSISGLRDSGTNMTRYIFTTIIGWSLFSCTIAFADTTAYLTLPSGVAVRIVEAPFAASRDTACRINGRPVHWGNTDTPPPKTYVKSLTISFKGRSYALDASCMYNAWGRRPLEVPGVIRYFGGKCSDAKNCAFRGIFADASETFVAEWRIRNGMPIRTVFSSSEDIVNLFMKNIDPPDFE